MAIEENQQHQEKASLLYRSSLPKLPLTRIAEFGYRPVVEELEMKITRGVRVQIVYAVSP
jgi:hypothetical protein